MGLDDVYKQVNGLSSGKTGRAGKMSAAPFVMSDPKVKARAAENAESKSGGAMHMAVTEGQIVDEILSNKPSMSKTARIDKTKRVDKQDLQTTDEKVAKTSAPKTEPQKTLKQTVKFATGSAFNQTKFKKNLSRHLATKRITHISQGELKKFVDIVSKKARYTSTGNSMGRHARTGIRNELTAAWKRGEMSREDVSAFKNILNDL